MRRPARRLILPIGSAWIVACSLFPSLSGLDDGGVDANMSDAAIDAYDHRTDVADATKPDVHDAGSEALVEAAPPPDAPYLLCGSHDCLVGLEVCCVPLGTTNPTCAPTDAGCPDADVAMACDDPSDCTLLGFPNTFCCVTELPSDVGKSVQCSTTCAVASGTSTRLCDPADASTCGPFMCLVSTSTLPGIYICK